MMVQMATWSTVLIMALLMQDILEMKVYRIRSSSFIGDRFCAFLWFVGYLNVFAVCSWNICFIALKQSGQRFSVTPQQITPRLTPSQTPKIVSASGSPRAYSAVGSPERSGATTPTKSYDGRISLSSWYPSSQQSSAASSPPRVRAMPSKSLMHFERWI